MAQSQQPQLQMQQPHQQQQHQQHEFLPLCDVLFNIISLASYFCDVVFDLAMAYALAHHRQAPPLLFPLSIGLVIGALFVSQVVSLRWYLWGPRGRLTKSGANGNLDSLGRRKSTVWTVWCIILLHSTQIGVLWRYFKLFIPVDLKYVKHEVRELCVLRLIHAFCEAAPMLLLQLYVLSIGVGSANAIKDGKVEESKREGGDKLAELTAVSAGLSLWSVCWAVASFSKGAARLRNLERLVLTWLGVLAQLAWRLGTVSARVGALVAYASLYGGQWLLIVMALHWLSMLTWLLLTPDGLFHGGERLSFSRKAFLAGLLAFVYVFAYVNLHETNHRQKMVIFYTVMFLENSLLIGVWAVGINESDPQSLGQQPRPIVLVLVLLALFFGGLIFMGLYYRFFHVRRLRYEAGGRMNGTNIVATLSNQDIVEEKQVNYNDDENGNNDEDDEGEDEDEEDDDDDDDEDEDYDRDVKKVDCPNGTKKVKLSNGGIPGVFNCRFANPTVTNLNRKKKKPTTFVPPPPTQQQPAIPMLGETKPWASNGNANARQLIPFWRRPLSGAMASTVSTGATVTTTTATTTTTTTTTTTATTVATTTTATTVIGHDDCNKYANDNDDDDIENDNNDDDDENEDDDDQDYPEKRKGDEDDDNDDDGDEWSEKKNEIDVAVGSLNVNLIREKLREKKQQQLRELRAIQEEIKEGKLVPPPSASTSSFSSSLSATNQQPPPNTKLHTSPNLPLSGATLMPLASLPEVNDASMVTLTCWPPTKMHCLLPPPPSSPYHPTSHPANIWKGLPRAFRAGTPEILLAPRCLPHHCNHWTPSTDRLRSNENGEVDSSKGECEGDVEVSDMEGSQVSLPRSYTLPREFKYNNSNGSARERHVPAGKLHTSRFYLPSTNSSDGDVDSADNEDETDSELQERMQNEYALGQEGSVHGRCFAYESGETMDVESAEPHTSSMLVGTLGCYLSNSYGVIRPNQLQRAKVKHETKL